MKKDEPAQTLIFKWRAPEGVFVKLMMWVGVALVVLSVLLLMFEVVYPAPSRRPHTMQRITLLDSSSPKAREVIAAVTDRNFLLLAPNANAAPTLSELRPVFSPGFKDFQLQVKDLPETGPASSTLPRLFGPERTLLPAVAVAKVPQAPGPTRKLRLVAIATDGLSGRKVVHEVEPLPENSPALGEINARFRVAVAPDGRVLAAASLMDESSDASAAVSRAFRQAIDQLRFSPVQTPGPQWGVIVFRWKGEKS